MKFTILLLSEISCLPTGCAGIVILVFSGGSCLIWCCSVGGEGVEIGGVEMGGVKGVDLGAFSVGSDTFGGTLRGDLNLSRCFDSAGEVG